jgi:hypothetical protein
MISVSIVMNPTWGQPAGIEVVATIDVLAFVMFALSTSSPKLTLSPPTSLVSRVAPGNFAVVAIYRLPNSFAPNTSVAGMPGALGTHDERPGGHSGFAAIRVQAEAMSIKNLRRLM